MLIAKVVGTVVASQKSSNLNNERFLLLEKINYKLKSKKDYIVALDQVGAGKDEIVIVSEGSATRETPLTVDMPVDALIVGIVDIIDENGLINYRK